MSQQILITIAALLKIIFPSDFDKKRSAPWAAMDRVGIWVGIQKQRLNPNTECEICQNN